MIFSHNWLQKYFENKIPTSDELMVLLNAHSFEVEGVEVKEKDTLIDIDVLPNRSHDCFSYEGIAKEISVLTGLKMKESHVEVVVENGLKSSDYISLSVNDSNLIPRATKRIVKDVKVEASPDWLVAFLRSIGQKSINNIVDATNFIMWETGQPVHAFDFDKIAGNGVKEILIRNAENGEKINTLDGAEYELNENVLVISDKEKALDIAGIKGGSVSGIDENTKTVVLSVCNFNQTNIRKTSRKLGLRTDASLRFENGITPEKVSLAMERLSKLVADLTGGKIAEDIVEVYPRKANPYKVGLSTEEANKKLGTKLSDEEVENILNRFGFEFEKIKPLERVLEIAETFVGVPYESGASVTYDAPNKFDCSSFTAYLFSQVGIAIPRISVDQYVFGKEISKEDLKAGDLVFANTGLVIKTGIYKETIEFLPGTKVPEGVDHVGLYLGDGKLIHTSSKTEKAVVEDLDKAEMFKNIVGYRRVIEDENLERYVVTAPAERLDLRIKEDLIEEIGRLYGYKNIESVLPEKVFEPKINKTFYYTNKIRNILTDLGFSEVYTYVFGDRGEVEVQKPLASHLSHLRTNLSGEIQKSLDLNTKNAPLLGLSEVKVFEIGKVFPAIDGEYTSFALGVKAKKQKVIFASLGEAIQELNKELGVDLKVKENEQIIEINFDELIEKLPQPESYKNVLENDDRKILFSKISPYPFMLRDISVFIPNENNGNDVLNIIKENAGELLVQTKLFDTYAPEGGDKTSYAFNLVFQSQEKTLTDEEINKIMEKISSEMINK
ncbi:C40 family peptidase, partial [Patescibacteria group bacterium]|nr:C40 family peptidase [Patescibacteria group bacterium]